MDAIGMGPDASMLDKHGIHRANYEHWIETNTQALAELDVIMAQAQDEGIRERLMPYYRELAGSIAANQWVLSHWELLRMAERS